MWSGFNVYGNLGFWKALPADVQEIVQRNVRSAVAAQRENVRQVNDALAKKLKARGMTFNTADIASFRRRLDGSFYAALKAEIGAIAWGLLETEAGRLG